MEFDGESNADQELTLCKGTQMEDSDSEYTAE